MASMFNVDKLDPATIGAFQQMLGVQVTNQWDSATENAFLQFQNAKTWGSNYGLTGNTQEWTNLVAALKGNDRSQWKGPEKSSTPYNPKTDNPQSGSYVPKPKPTDYGSATDQDAKSSIAQSLSEWGLGSLTDWAWNQIQQGNSNILPYLIRQTQEYKQRFSGNEARRAAGLNVLSESQYLQLENNYRDLMHNYGIPSGVWDTQSSLGKLIAGDVSVSELNTRLQSYAEAAYSAPQETRDALQKLYGVTPGELTAFFIDPQAALPLIEQRYAAAGVAGVASRANFGDIGSAFAERLAQLGAGNNSQTYDAFSNLRKSTELFNPLGDTERVSTSATTDQQGAVVSPEQAAVAAFGGDAATQDMLTRRAKGRAAVYQGGGELVAKTSGVVGLGSST